MNKVLDIYNLSHLQKGFLFHSKFEENSDGYIIQDVMDISGFDVETVKKTLKFLVRTYSIFRTGFDVTKSGKSYQFVLDEVIPEFYEYSLDSSVSNVNEKLDEIIYTDRNTGFDLSKPPLIRFLIINLQKNVTKLVWSYHHIILDGWSSNLVFKKFLEIYNDLISNRFNFKEEPISYKAYIDYLDSLNEKPARKFWTNYLNGIEDVTNFSFEDLISNSSEDYAEVSYVLPQKYAESLFEFCNKNKLTANTVVLGLFGILLKKYLNHDDITIGMTVSGRDANVSGIENIVGLLINTLPIRLKPQGDLIAYFSNLQNQVQDISEFAHVSLAEILKLSGLGHDLFNVQFAFENYADGKSYCERNIQKTEYPLSIVVERLDQTFKIRFLYKTNCFNEKILERFYNDFSAISLNDDRSIESIQLVSGDSFVFNKNGELKKLAEENTIHGIFKRIAIENCNKVAVVDENTSITYGELDKTSDALANSLIDQSVSVDSYVALYLERSVEMIRGMLGILKAGAAYVPLDVNYPDERLKYIAASSKASIVLTTSTLKDKAFELFGNLNIKIVVIDTLTSVEANEQCPVKVSSQNIAYVIYTSGSTGRPKGVQIPHCGALNHLYSKIHALAMNERTVIAQTARMSFDISVWQSFAALLVGGKVVIINDDNVWNVEKLVEIIEHEKITILEIVPSLFPTFEQAFHQADIRNLEFLLLTGEALKTTYCKKWFEKNGSVVKLVNAYGPTECSDDVTHKFITPSDCQALEEKDCMSLGLSLDNLQLMVLDKDLNIVPVGCVGEICVGGIGLARGYFDMPALTADKFIANPFMNGERIYKTGDAGRFLPNGDLEFLGRIDKQVKIRGFRIELGEIEGAIGQLEAIDKVVVLPKNDNHGVHLVAYIVAKDSNVLDESKQVSEENGLIYSGNKSLEEQIIEKISNQLPEYMVPVVYVFLNKIPLTPNGKIDNDALLALNIVVERKESNEVLSDTEKTLCDIWKEVLNLDSICTKDNFFRIGGDSILAMQIVSIAKRKGLIFSVKDVFNAPTIARLAKVAKQDSNTEQIEYTVAPFLLSPVDKETLENEQNEKLKDAYPLSFMQSGFLFRSLYEHNNADYFIQNVMHLSHVNIERFHQAWNIIFNTYDILKARVVNGETALLVIPDGELEIPFSIVDFSDKPNIDDEISKFLNKDREMGVDLLSDSLIRIVAIKKSQTEYCVVWSYHHILLDGWSVAIVVQNLLATYSKLCSDQQVTVQDNNPFRNFIALSSFQEAPIDFWKSYLSSVEDPTYLCMKADCEACSNGVERYKFSEAQTNQIKKFCGKLGITANSFALGILALTISKYLNQDDVVLGITVSGRNNPKFDNIVGLLINTLPVRVSCTGSADEFFHSVQDEVQTLSEKAYCSLAEILKLTEFREKLFNVQFVFENYPVTKVDSTLEVLKNDVFEQTEYDLTVVSYIDNSQLLFQFEYSGEKFDKASIDRLFSYIQRVVDSLNISDVRDICLPFGEEANRITQVANPEKSSEIVMETCVDYLEKQFEEHKEKVAVICDGESLTYGALNEYANRIANRLLMTEGFAKDSIVAICLPRSIDMVASIIGTLKAGASYMPLDMAYPVDRLKYMMGISKVRIVLVNDESAALANEICSDNITMININHEQDKFLNVNPNVAIHPDNGAYVIFTSGSTGVPKGVMASHGSVLNHLKERQKLLALTEPETVVIQSARFSFDLSVWQTLAPLMSGGTVLLLKNPEDIFDDVCLSCNPTHFEMVPSLFKYIHEHMV